MISTTPPVVTTSRTPFAIVKSPDKTVVTKPVDIGIPVAQTACGVQILSGMFTRLFILPLITVIVIFSLLDYNPFNSAYGC